MAKEELKKRTKKFTLVKINQSELLSCEAKSPIRNQCRLDKHYSCYVILRQAQSASIRLKLAELVEAKLPYLNDIESEIRNMKQLRHNIYNITLGWKRQ